MLANPTIAAADLGFFSTLASAGSLSAAARELGVTTSAVSRRLASMESRLGVPLVTRSTRRMRLTPEGTLYVEHARHILGQIDDLAQQLGQARSSPAGLLRVNATLGFGRSHVAPVLSRFMRRHPAIDVQLQLSVNPPALTDDAFDVCVRFGPPPDARVIARLVAPNRRLLCAAPAYLAARGTPRTPMDLERHDCIEIRQGDDPYGVWRLSSGRGTARRTQAVRPHVRMSTNDGEIAVRWSLDGHGIVMRAEWDVAAHLRSGRLVQLLPQYMTPDADIYLVYPQRNQLSTRVRAFVDFFCASFAT